MSVTHDTSELTPITAVVVGCGGIGYRLAEPLTRLLAARPDSQLFLIDGKAVKPDNVSRQHGVDVIGLNKAEALAARLTRLVGPEKVRITAIPFYFDRPDAAQQRPWLELPHPHVFCGVDTAASRVFLEDRLATLPTVTLVSGGNEFFSGQATIWLRRDKRDLTPRPSQLDPDLRRHDQRLPSEIPCDENVVHYPQLGLANDAAALAMLCLWYARVYAPQDKPTTSNYVTFDVRRAELYPAKRAAIASTTPVS